MAGYRYVYTIDDSDWLEKVRQIDVAKADMRPALKDAGEYMLAEVDDRFRKEQGPDGTPWKELSSATLKKKKGTKILQDAGRRGGLRDSIAYEVTRNSVAHGTNKIYGAIHQLGGDAGRGHAVHIDARPYLGFSGENLAHIAQLLIDHIEPK